MVSNWYKVSRGLYQMPTAKITAALLDKLESGAILWDTEVRGLGARRSARGITFIFKAREPIGGRQVLMTIGQRGRGDYGIDDARKVATGWRLMIRDGQDPRTEKADPSEVMTVSELCDAYLEAAPTLLISRAGRAKKATTLHTDKSRIEAHIKPLLGKLLVPVISQADIETFLQRVAAGATKKARGKGRGNPATGGKGTASRTVGLLGAIFSYAVKCKLRADNPVRGVVRFADQRKERRLSAEEYKALGAGLAKAAEHKVNPYGIAAVRFLALSGWRRGEAVNLKWSDIDAARRTVTLGDTKTGRSIRPLANAVLDTIKDLPRRAGNPHVFPATKGEGAISNLPRLFDVIRTKAKLPDDITPHVLRHSVASLASDAGLSEATIAGLLGHKLGTITSRYTHSADAVMLKAADTVADMVQGLMGEARAAGEVVSLKART